MSNINFHQVVTSLPNNTNPVFPVVIDGIEYTIQQCTENDVNKLSHIILVKDNDNWIICQNIIVKPDHCIIFQHFLYHNEWYNCNFMVYIEECYYVISYSKVNDDAILPELPKDNSMGVLERLTKLNPIRCKAAFGFEVDEWSMERWATALSGEVGELCNFIKKEFRDGVDHTEDIKKEAADVLIYLDFICQRRGFRLADVVVEKFNEVSKKKKVNIFL